MHKMDSLDDYIKNKILESELRLKIFLKLKQIDELNILNSQYDFTNEKRNIEALKRYNECLNEASMDNVSSFDEAIINLYGISNKILKFNSSS